MCLSQANKSNIFILNENKTITNRNQAFEVVLCLDCTSEYLYIPSKKNKQEKVKIYFQLPIAIFN